MDRRDRNIGTPVRKSLLALGALAALAGCSAPTSSEMVLACPKVSIVRDLAEVTQFRAGGRDGSDVVTRAALADYSGNCDYTRDGVTVNLSLYVIAERGPALQGNQASYRYFVAVTPPNETQPRAKTEFESTIDFPAGQPRAGNKEEVTPTIPLPRDANAKDWQVLVGFQLTPEQLAYNRSQMKR
ncbi:lipoprotein [Azospirillum sp.]|uniref:lipoprotein n=1 Tax=Azospirillum sp. TaxID=34012 RepID=UPI002D5AA983|nr:lipoprotein [Azospirillum sp.]HYD67055.1 lipoprotein [Azospirillum sp.]